MYHLREFGASLREVRPKRVSVHKVFALGVGPLRHSIDYLGG